MSTNRNRDDFPALVIAALAKRSGFRCAICGANTIGPSAQSALSVTNIGVAAHVTAAARGGPRYDASLTPDQRRSIENGIWLCQNHAKSVDSDLVTYSGERLKSIKRTHERKIREALGIPHAVGAQFDSTATVGHNKAMTAREFAFMPVKNVLPPYRDLISPILKDRDVGEEAILGVLMCTGPARDGASGAEWTVFVEARWLEWFLSGQTAGYKSAPVISPDHILGCVPAWPDSFPEFLEAMVLTDTTFVWQRHGDGYLVLGQQQPPQDEASREA